MHRFDDNSGSNNGYDSASEEETESIFDEANGAPNAQEEDEDMERREEELRAELNFATCRVEELKRTLQETKSFLGPRLPTRGKDAPMTAKGREGPRGGEDVFEEEVDDEEDEDFDFDESDGEVRTLWLRVYIYCFLFGVAYFSACISGNAHHFFFSSFLHLPHSFRARMSP